MQGSAPTPGAHAAINDAGLPIPGAGAPIMVEDIPIPNVIRNAHFTIPSAGDQIPNTETHIHFAGVSTSATGTPIYN